MGKMCNYFFLYDNSKVKEEGDPTRAGICYFYPIQTVLDQQELLCGQIAGVVRCVADISSAPPSLIKLRRLKFAIKVDGDYLWALGCAVEIPDVSCMQFLGQLIQLFKFYNGPVRHAYQVHPPEDLSSKWDLYLEHIQNTSDLHKIFNSLQNLDKTKVDPLLLLKAALILQTCQRCTHVLAGCILYKGLVVSTQLPPQLTAKVMIRRPGPDTESTDEDQDKDNHVLPQDISFSIVFLTKEEACSLRQFPVEWMNSLPPSPKKEASKKRSSRLSRTLSDADEEEDEILSPYELEHKPGKQHEASIENLSILPSAVPVTCSETKKLTKEINFLNRNLSDEENLVSISTSKPPNVFQKEQSSTLTEINSVSEPQFKEGNCIINQADETAGVPKSYIFDLESTVPANSLQNGLKKFHESERRDDKYLEQPNRRTHVDSVISNSQLDGNGNSMSTNQKHHEQLKLLAGSTSKGNVFLNTVTPNGVKRTLQESTLQIKIVSTAEISGNQGQSEPSNEDITWDKDILLSDSENVDISHTASETSLSSEQLNSPDWATALDANASQDCDSLQGSGSSEDLVRMSLYAHRVSSLVLTLLTEEGFRNDKNAIEDVYHSSLASLNGLEVHLKETVSKKQATVVKVAYNFTHYDCIQNVLNGNLPQEKTSSDLKFIRATNLIHSDFHHFPTVHEMTARNASTAIYGCQNSAQETYFQQLAAPPSNSGVPNPHDGAFSLPGKAKQKLLKHGVNLL
ncbi:Hermansky-Pudlak syndrome 4 protein isoform X1 [Latimeria chalumnae]|uniref:Hermansky-Pudlak syndrome 4 protein isoform X1 n=1 Tax=Latimeria chalumnae TaxID=7897 RepID=UPI0003C1006F|nr:PREDICTED: Hermansky-Pudlak syndrome 4 protein isoform X2 [Latimeria chalumnae]|eukprot:XP_006007263.1 PREDICTED: Hermansky-Pudlak syndrome 4 protein isoform X2 [Latimeria chalumnae]